MSGLTWNRCRSSFAALGLSALTAACSSTAADDSNASTSNETGGGSGSGAGSSSGGISSIGSGGSGSGGNDPGRPGSVGGNPGAGGGSGETFDCSTISEGPMELDRLPGPRGTRGIAFGADGQMITGTAEGVFRSTANSTQLLLPGVDASHGQIGTMAGGDILLASGVGLGIFRITPEGARSTFHANYDKYTVSVGPKNMIYVSDVPRGTANSRVMRIDQDTAQAEEVVEMVNTPGLYHHWLRSIEFSPKLDIMYIGTESSVIWKVALDADFNPVGEPTPFVDLTSYKSARAPCLDTCKVEALGVDICGNVYAALLFSSSLVRISPDGSDVSTIWVSGAFDYVHAMSWGPLVGNEFKYNSLYVALPFYQDVDPVTGMDIERHDVVAELPIGVPHRSWPGTAINQ